MLKGNPLIKFLGAEVFGSSGQAWFPVLALGKPAWLATLLPVDSKGSSSNRGRRGWLSAPAPLSS